MRSFNLSFMDFLFGFLIAGVVSICFAAWGLTSLSMCMKHLYIGFLTTAQTFRSCRQHWMPTYDVSGHMHSRSPKSQIHHIASTPVMMIMTELTWADNEHCDQWRKGNSVCHPLLARPGSRVCWDVPKCDCLYLRWIHLMVECRKACCQDSACKAYLPAGQQPWWVHVIKSPWSRLLPAQLLLALYT